MARDSLSVLVFCGSRTGRSPAYLGAATEMGRLIADHGWRLIYGAGDVGLMGAVADAAIAAGGDTLGVIPTHLLPREGKKQNLNRLIITETMHERKKVMVMNADAIVLLPGGAGSLDEIFETLTWAQLGLHDKPIFVVNTGGYWDRLVALIDHVIEEDFASSSLQGLFSVVSTPAEVTQALSDR